MLKFDQTTNLLMQAKYRYDLQDVAEPNLYREIYDYEHVPKVAFNMRHVPMQMPDEIWMTVLPLHGKRPESPAPLPGCRPPLPGDHHLDPRQ